MKALEPETIEQIEKYANGQASDIEARLIQKLLQDRPEYREYYDFFTNLSNAIKQEIVEPPIWLKEKIMSVIKTPNRLRAFVQYASLAACFTGIFVFDILIGNRLKAIDVTQTTTSSSVTIASLSENLK